MSLSDQRRQISRDSSAMRSSARRLRGQGYGGAAQEMAFAAEKARLGEPNIRSAPEERAAANALEKTTGLLRRREADLLLGGADAQGAAAPAAVGGSSLGTSGSSLGTSGSSLGTSGSSLGTSGSSLGTTGSSLGTTGSSLGTTGSSLGTMEMRGKGDPNIARSAAGAESLRDQEMRRRREITAAGGFGRAPQAKAENLSQRQALFQEMQGEGAADRVDEFRSRAAKLGVSEERWNATTARMAWNAGPTESASDTYEREPEEFGPPSELAGSVRDREHRTMVATNKELIAKSRAQREASAATSTKIRERMAARREAEAQRMALNPVDTAPESGISETKNTALDVSTTSPTTREEKAESLRYGKNWREQVVARKEPEVFNAAVEAAGGKKKWDALSADEKTALLQRTKRYEALVKKAGGEEAFHKMSPSESKKLFDEIDAGLNF